jgi:Tol biopolymer transport system component
MKRVQGGVGKPRRGAYIHLMSRLAHPLTISLLTALTFGCGDGSGPPPIDPTVLHDVLVYEQRGHLGVVAPDGSGERLIPIGDSIAAIKPAVSPDGRRIAFLGIRELGGDDHYDVYVVNADGTGRRQLTDDDFYEAGPAWLPSGDSLSFVGPSPGNPAGVLVVVAADGSGRRELPEAGSVMEPRWSPDGTRVAFYGFGDREVGIYLMDADGSDIARVDQICDLSLAPHCYDSEPRWSPDGASIGFMRIGDDDLQSAGVMRADGSASRVLHPDLMTWAPVWSPDGERVAITGSDASGVIQLYVVTVETGDTLRLPVTNAFVGDWAR